MLDEQTYEKLMGLKLPAMAEAFLELQKEAPGNQRSFAEKIGYMVDRECDRTDASAEHCEGTTCACARC
ncbi:MAG: hypothetical protein AAGF11_13290 [Myxococcota bacterium]